MSREKLVFIGITVILLMAMIGCLSKQAPEQEPGILEEKPVSTQEEATEEIVEIRNTMNVLIVELEGIDGEI